MKNRDIATLTNLHITREAEVTRLWLATMFAAICVEAEFNWKLCLLSFILIFVQFGCCYMSSLKVEAMMETLKKEEKNRDK